MKYLICISLFIFTFGSFAFAQQTENLNGNTKPILVDEFNNLTDAELKEKFIEFETKINKKKGSTAYVVNYGSAKDVAKRERVIRDVIKKEGLFHYGGLVIINGGFEKEILTRFWIIPKEAADSDFIY